MNTTVISIHPGSGGDESIDWCNLLRTMYIRWCARSGIDVIGIESSCPGHFSIHVSGDVFDRLRGEVGVHRLVRVSPFDEQQRRHTSFASVDVTHEGRERVSADPYIAVRGYTLDPYMLAVDRRTGIETEDVASVLDGDIDRFLVGGMPPA